MPFSLALPRYLAKAGWKVKIQDKESRETPHMTVWFKKQKWRVSLRDGRFMDGGSWNDVPPELRQIVTAGWQRLREEWDARYGNVNPVWSEAESNE